MAILSLRNIDAYYDEVHTLRDVSLELAEGEVACVLGRNGAGKTTTLLTVMGLLPVRRGAIDFDGKLLNRLLPHQVARAGIGYVPQERGIFASLTVEENLLVARRPGRRNQWTAEKIYEIFPRLKERKNNLGYQLSGGEQQMLSIGRALMLNPRLLLLDEPSEGLAPTIVELIANVITQLKAEGLPILLVEQNLGLALDVGDRHYVLSKGAVLFSGTSAELARNEEVQSSYLSV
jgi:branched-chain amino acid transport system ATP-binding protein